MGDNSKIIFPSMGFSYPGNLKKLILSSKSHNGVLGPFLLFKEQKAILQRISIKIKVYEVLEDLFITRRTCKHRKHLMLKMLRLKIYKKGVQRLRIWLWLPIKARYPTKFLGIRYC